MNDVRIGLAIIVAITITASAIVAYATCAKSESWGPTANEGYCIGVAPENCPYEWTFYEGRWRYTPRIHRS